MRRSALRRPDSIIDRYRIIGKIGEGTYGMVFKAEAYASLSGSSSHARSGPSAGTGGGSADDEDPMTFAIKLVKSHKEGKNDVVLSSATIREIKLLRELNHDNVVHLHDVFVDPREKTLALVFEYADHDLHDIIVQSKQKPLSEYTRKSLMYQILKGVDYMHDAWIMHRDMKPQNILVVGHGRKRGQVKLADFGLARLYKEPIKALSDVERVVVTLWYRAPELLLGAKHYTKAVDMWAVGCIFAEIVNARELFCGKEVEGTNAPFQKDQLDKIFKVLGLPTPQTWEGMDSLPEYAQVVQMGRERKYPSQSELRNAVKFGSGRSGAALYDLIAKLLEYDPEHRITAKDALEHEYFKIEPEPRDWSFDEPGKEPVAFRTQNVEPVQEDSLPWKSRKEAATNDTARGDSPSHRDGRSQHRHDHASARDSSSSRRSSYHASSSSAAGPSGGAAGNAGPATSSRGGSGWRDRSVGRGSSASAAASSSSASAAPAAGSGAGAAHVGSKRPAPVAVPTTAAAAAVGASERPGSASSRTRSPKSQRRR
ncbi:hypothetical protein P43SY_008979 [Pythium insidiosum]|uniref:Cyclin-dependent kinase 2 homolog n=1 Tax=Pythium insidiosum TaxID=114742 RepID=A0AAD5LS54_PYTIN|nr:hypothetical protein P43SY_008979 [Pythium insidiosum]